MKHEIVVNRFSEKLVTKEGYREVGKNDQGEPINKYVSYDRKEVVLDTVFRVTLDSFDVQELLEFLAARKKTFPTFVVPKPDADVEVVR